ncbi:MAG: gliding motility protein GldN [Bacteroidales bacterium]|nr:gliding motility protein GldN [Bacteroidales bacterium]
MKRLFLLGLVVLLFSSAGFSQSFGDIYDKSIDNNEAIPYPFLREADVAWSKRIWRLIDLREKMNHTLYYPITDRPDGRQSLMSVILGEIKAGNLNAFDPNAMTVSVTYSDIEANMGAGADTVQIPDMQGVMQDTVIYNEPNPEDIKQLMVLEEWYFDKKHSRMDVRIIGIQPIRVFMDQQLQRMSRVQLFWIHFEDYRDTFAKHEVFNPFNDAQRLSFDDIFMQRRFGSTVYAESNVYDDRLINQYKTGKSALYEAEKIENELRVFEHDLWEY